MTQRFCSGTRAMVLAAMVIIGAAGCGSGSPGAPSGSAPTGAPSSGGSSGGSTDITAPTIPPGEAPTGAPMVPGSGQAGGKAGGGVAELTGTVEAGVESGCVVLTGGGGAVLANLIGLDTATTPVGTQVIVIGTFQQDLMTTCQQGTPFEVTSVKKR